MAKPNPKKNIYYLASPYSTPKLKWVPKIFTLFYRNHIMQRFATVLIKQGYILIEPISMCFYKSLLWNLPQEYGYWMHRDRKFIGISNGVIVCNMPGWKKSVGVTDEITFALSNDVPVYLCSLGKNDKLKFEKITSI